MSQANARFCFCLAIALMAHAALFGWASHARVEPAAPLLEATRAAGAAAAESPNAMIHAVQHQRGADDHSQRARRAMPASPTAQPQTAPDQERTLTRFVVVAEPTPAEPEKTEPEPVPAADVEHSPQRERVLAAARDARAAYLAAWQQRIETRGSRRYARRLLDTDEPRRLTLAARLSADGTLRAVRILRSSGNPELDAVALAIVRGAAPFAPFDPALATVTDELSFVYDWSFEPGGATAISPSG